MKIKITTTYSEPWVTEVEMFVDDALRERSRNASGAIESAEALAESCVEALSRLVNALCENGALTDKQVGEIVDFYGKVEWVK